MFDIYKKLRSKAVLCECSKDWFTALHKWGFHSYECCLGNSAQYTLNHTKLDELLIVQENQYLVYHGGTEFEIIDNDQLNKKYVVDEPTSDTDRYR